MARARYSASSPLPSTSTDCSRRSSAAVPRPRSSRCRWPRRPRWPCGAARRVWRWARSGTRRWPAASGPSRSSTAAWPRWTCWKPGSRRVWPARWARPLSATCRSRSTSAARRGCCGRSRCRPRAASTCRRACTGSRSRDAPFPRRPAPAWPAWTWSRATSRSAAPTCRRGSRPPSCRSCCPRARGAWPWSAPACRDRPSSRRPAWCRWLSSPAAGGRTSRGRACRSRTAIASKRAT